MWGECKTCCCWHQRYPALAVCTLLGTVKMSCTSRDPQRGQRKRLSRRESGKPRPLVHTSVSMSSSARKTHSLCRCMPSCLPAAQRAVTRQPYDRAYDGLHGHKAIENGSGTVVKGDDVANSIEAGLRSPALCKDEGLIAEPLTHPALPISLSACVRRSSQAR
jgi:hypothetical protein